MLNVFKGPFENVLKTGEMLNMLNVLNVWGKSGPKNAILGAPHLTYLTFPPF